MSPPTPDDLTHDDSPPPAIVYGPAEHKLSRNEIDDDARKVVFRLQKSGFKAYIVGGGVRDLLLGKLPKDFDISTDATPREIKSLFRNCRIIGRRFKLAHVYFAHGKALEVSTFRDAVEWLEPAEGESGESTVASDNVFGTEATDAVRRDLTINGLFLDVSTMEIIDYVGGMTDLHNGIIRVIGDPDIRFREDPVRMIRVVRHSARNGFQIERGCWTSILENAERITQCSQVRVFDELRKDFTSGCFLTILNLLAETGLLAFILPELLENNATLLSAQSDCSRCLEIIDDLVNEGADVSPTVVLTIMALFTAGDSIWLRDIIERIDNGHDLGERLASAFTRLTVPRKEREKIMLLIRLWLRVKDSPAGQFRAGNFKRSALLGDLVVLLEATITTREDTDHLRALKKVLEAHSDDHSEDHDSDHPRPFIRRGRR